MPLTLSVEAQLEAGTIRLGGSCIDADSPIWLCLSCESAWGFSPLSDPDYLSKWLRRQSGDA